MKAGCNENCRGCRYKNHSFADSLEQKFVFVKQKLAPWENCILPLEHVSETSSLHYRDKLCLSTDFIDNVWKIGLRQKLEIVEIPDCPLHKQNINLAIQFTKNKLPHKNTFPLHYLYINGSHLVFIVKQKALPDCTWIDNDYKRHLSDFGINTIWVHPHPSVGKKIFGKSPMICISGNKFSTDETGLPYGPTAFRQLLPELHNKSLMASLDFFKLLPGDLVIDLYSGRGTSLNLWNSKKANCIGVEISGEAVEIANAPHSHYEVLRGKCKDRIPQLQKWINGKQTQRLNLYANPPRTGFEPEIINWIITQLKPKKISYLSCSPGTLFKDLIQLEKGGYKVSNIIPYDFFPGTHHVECLVNLEINVSA